MCYNATASVGLVGPVDAVLHFVAKLLQRHAAGAVIAAQRGRRALLHICLSFTLCTLHVGGGDEGRDGGGVGPRAARLVRPVETVHVRVATELLQTVKGVRHAITEVAEAQRRALTVRMHSPLSHWYS